MKQIISGKLGKNPELKEVETKEGKRKVVNITVFAYDPSGPEVKRPDGSTYRKGIPLQCTAWGPNAEEIAKMKAGDTLTASTTMRYHEYSRKDGSKVVEPNFVIKRIDPENDIHRQLSTLLTGYEAGEYDQIAEKDIKQPEFGKDQAMQLSEPDKEPEPAMEA